VPSAKVTQTLGPTLVFEHPVWKVRLVPVVVPVTLYTAVNNRPVVGFGVMPDPRADAAASSIVSIVSELEQVEPLTKIPDRHSTRIVGVP
jgi:hypothetical protein